MDKIAVLIPCYNEGQTIAKVVKDYREALPEATIYVYDNNSSDHTDCGKHGKIRRGQRSRTAPILCRQALRRMCFLPSSRRIWMTY